MNELLISLLSAIVATNPPVAVSNLVLKNTGMKVAVAATSDPVEQEYQKLMVDDDVAQAEVDEWILKRNRQPTSQSDVEKAALNARIRRRFDPIRKGYEDFLTRHPGHVEARIAYGSFLNDIGDEPAAEVQWEKARELGPTNPAAWNNLANLNGHSGDVKKSFAYYAKAMELDPAEPVYVQNLATTVFLFRKDAMEHFKITEQEVFAKAMDLYRKALALDPGNFKMSAELAQTYYGIKVPQFDDTNATQAAKVKLAEEAMLAWRDAQKLSSNALEREGIQIHLARWQINLGRTNDARRSLNVVTNDIWQASKKTQLRRLGERVDAEASTNLPPASAKPASP